MTNKICAAYIGSNFLSEIFEKNNSASSIELVKFDYASMDPRDFQAVIIDGNQDVEEGLRWVDYFWRCNRPVLTFWNYIPDFDDRFHQRVSESHQFGASDRKIEEALAHAAKLRDIEKNNFGMAYARGNRNYLQLKAISERSRAILFRSEAARDYANSLNMKMKNAIVIPAWPIQVPSNKYATSANRRHILTPGDIAPRNNQLGLVRALKSREIPIVLYGDIKNGEYLDAIKSQGAKLEVRPAMSAAEPEYKALLEGALVCCMPSLDMNMALNALDFAMHDIPLAISESDAAREWFGESAYYFDPLSSEDIAVKVDRAVASPLNFDKEAVFARMRAACVALVRVVEEAAIPAESVKKSQHRTRKLYVDITHSWRSAKMSGVPRVEAELCQGLDDIGELDINFIVWDENTGRYHNCVKSGSFVKDEISPETLRISSGPLIIEKYSYLFLIGVIWFKDERYVNAILSLVGKYNLNFYLFIHDIIKSKFAYMRSNDNDSHTRNLLSLIPAAAATIVTSDATSSDLAEFIQQNQVPIPYCSRIRLGDTPKLLMPGISNSINSFIGETHGAPFILCVSGFEFRKNHLLLYHLYRSLLSEFDKTKIPHLVCVGNYQKIFPFYDFFYKDDLIKDHVHLLFDIDDSFLIWLYQNCLFTVYPSHYEGWGLPVAESLVFGKICVASNASSIKEIAPLHTDLLDPLDFPAWRQRVCDYIFDADKRANREAHVRTYRPFTWADSARQLNEIFRGDYIKPPCSPLLAVGEYITFTGGCPGDAGIRRRIAARENLFFEVGFHRGGSSPQQVECMINGVPVMEFQLPPGDSQVIIPCALREPNGAIQEIHLTIEPVHERQNGKAPDISMVSLLLRQATSEEKRVAGEVASLASLSDKAPFIFHTLLKARPDVWHSVHTLKKPCLGMLVWVWHHGLYEFPWLQRHCQTLKKMLDDLEYLTSDTALVEGYNVMLDTIHEMREDLKLFDISSAQGQKEMIDWYTRYGRAEIVHEAIRTCASS